MNRYRWTAFLLVLMIACSSLVFAQSNKVQNMDIVDADIRDVFRSLGELGGYNVLLDKTVQGSVTFKVTNPLTVKEITEMIAQTYGYSFRWLNNNQTVIIGEAKTFEGFENRITKVYKLDFANVDQAAAAIEVIVPKERIGKDPRVNQLTIHANVLEHENIEEIVKRLDREVPQVNIEARVEEVSSNAMSELGFNTKFEGTFNTVSGWGIEIFDSLVALEQSNKARMLSRPNISTADNQEGRIFIGDKYPVITKDVTAEGITWKIEYIEIGTILTITPRINSDNVVTVNVKAEISNITDWKKAGDNDIPVITTREARSVVRLNDGDTFVLSGLKFETVTKTTSGVPYISKIPIIGWLFKTKKDTPEEREVLIFITPKIIKTTASDEAKKSENKIGTKTETPISKSNPVEETSISPSESVDIDEPYIEEEDESIEYDDEEEPLPPSDPIQVVIDEEVPAHPVEPEEEMTTDEPEITEAVDSDMIETMETTESADTGITTPVESKNPEERVETTTVKASKEVKYSVKKGESVYAIARKFGVDPKTVLERNKLSKDSGLSVGQTLIIPIPANHIYKLQPKETLWRLAKRYGVTVELLMELNDISDVTQIKAGQEIILPTSVEKVVNKQF